jgi:hypothetical protein
MGDAGPYWQHHYLQKEKGIAPTVYRTIARSAKLVDPKAGTRFRGRRTLLQSELNTL